ncbi:MAG: hypothetical protein GX808_04015 [Syntrophomonadaceae bacterium]|jgi:phi13 family phage major tail protein|nr:hypothetical protein [Syntrophomonadaceae bacterium]
MSKNKVKYGLKNVHYAPITEANGIVSYGTPKAHPGAVNIALSPVGDSVKFPADDIEDYFAENVNNGYDGDLELALVTDDFRIDILGDTVDANGALIENTNAKAKRFALLFEFDGDAKKTRHVLYNVLANRPNIEGATRSNKKEPKSESLSIEARPAIDTGDVKAKLEQDKAGYDTFFSAVYLKNAVLNAAGDDPADFSKAAPDDVEVISTSSGVTAVKNVLLNGLPVPGVSLTIAALQVTIASAYVSGLDLAIGSYPLVVEFTKGNSVIYNLTVKA